VRLHCNNSEELLASSWPWTHTLALHDEMQWPFVLPVELPVEILPHLFLGDVHSARRIERLKELGITHVLNVAGENTANADINYAEHAIEHLDLEAEDEEGYQMLPLHLASARAFIKQAVKANGRCLVHCRGGVNRSGVLVAAEVMLHEQIPVLEAVRRCREVRGLPYLNNRSFQHQLVKLAQRHSLLGPRPPGFEERCGTPPPPPPKAPPKTTKRTTRSVVAGTSSIDLLLNQLSPSGDESDTDEFRLPDIPPFPFSEPATKTKELVRSPNQPPRLPDVPPFPFYEVNKKLEF